MIRKMEAHPAPQEETMDHTIRISRELTADRAMELLREHGTIRAEIAVRAAAWNPASTRRKVHGPCTIQYVLHPDGGVDATVFTETKLSSDELWGKESYDDWCADR